jgi:Copper transport outer membrane protein, MctB
VISLRYHVVTIVAVFLALAVGLLAGSAFVEPELVDQLRQQTDILRGDVRELDRERTELRSQLAAISAFAEGSDAFVDAVTPTLTDGRLAGSPVIIVTQTGVEDEVLPEVQRALSSAGAQIVTTVSATDQIVSEDPTTQEELALILGEPTIPAEELPLRTAEALADRLSSNGSSVIGTDVLAELLSAGFLEPVGTGPSEATLAEIGAPGQVVVVLSGGRGEEPVLPPEAFAVPLVESLADLDVPVAAGESLLSNYDFVSIVRSDGVDGTVTVDDLDRSMGGAALVLGLERLLTTGVGGAYGVKDGAEPLPPLP